MLKLRSWDELTVVEQLQNTYSDYYKEVRGFRPRFMSSEEWVSERWLRDAINKLDNEAVDAIAAEEKRQQRAIADFEVRVTAIIAAGAKDRETAIKWLMDAAEVNNDPEYFCYQMNLPYNYFTIKKAA